jgi:hypothetical protein
LRQLGLYELNLTTVTTIMIDLPFIFII